MKQISLTQEFINAHRGMPNKFQERTGIDPMLIDCQAPISGNYLREDWILTNGKTVKEVKNNE